MIRIFSIFYMLLIMSFLISNGYAVTDNATLSLHNQTQLDAKYGYLKGYTQYQIGGDVSLNDLQRGHVRFPISELKYPINCRIININLHNNNSNQRFSIDIMKNLTTHSGKTEDSDWLTETGGKDIYSTSDTQFQLLNFKTKLLYNGLNWHLFNQNDAIFYGIQYDYNHTRFELSNIYQTYPGTSNALVDQAFGKAMKYQQTLHILSLVGMHSFQFGNLTIENSIALSPFILGFNEDDHLLRGKFSQGQTRGMSMELNSHIIMNIFAGFSMLGSVEYKHIKLVGDQNQSYYNYIEAKSLSDSIKINQEVIMQYYDITAGIQYLF